MPEHILSLSYGKDSLACLGAIEQLGWPLDRIVHAEVWATDTIPADLPPVVEFKAKADRIIKERWGVEVEHIRSSCTYEQRFYHKRGNRTKYGPGENRGWPRMKGAWCNSQVKMPPLKAIEKGGSIIYVGIAGDEPNRFQTCQIPRKALLWRLAGQKPCAENGARETTYCPPSTPQQPVVGAGSATTRAWASFGCCAKITRICGH